MVQTPYIELRAEKDELNPIYRLIGRTLYLKGVPNAQYYQLLNNFKQKGALKSHREKRGWIEIEFVDSITQEGLRNEFMQAIEIYLVKIGFDVKKVEGSVDI